ncbi:hypothetical protein [Solidesulfovibrio alcoholivorans]|uniref:hypothetical protein n=1 Tax=Solidesulfovibrio alcoholivorans TaxID=81406 RepID=UPI0012EB77C2|nr:hypothetical protein [Solidesulfovibrio alcoholivorans]HML54573.1 hypothetical protein [Solidesulfovibrio magneticus]
MVIKDGPYSGSFTPAGEAISGNTNAGQNLVVWRNKVFGHGVFKENRSWYAEQVLERISTLHLIYQGLKPILDSWALREADPNRDLMARSR